MMKVFLTTILLICFNVTAFGQGGNSDLRLRKSLRDKVDDIVFDFEVLGRLGSRQERERFAELFAEDALVFDFVTPNYITRNVGQQIQKPISQYIRDIASDFPTGLRKMIIIDSNLGVAIDFDELDLSDPTVFVQVKVSTLGDFREGGQFSNEAEIGLQIKFDTLNQRVNNLRIDQIVMINSELRYKKEEKTPKFEKMLTGNYHQSWNNLTTNQFDRNYNIGQHSIVQDYGYSAAFNFIKLISAPEPEEFSYSFGIGMTESSYVINLDQYFYSYLTTDSDEVPFFQNVEGSAMSELVQSRIVDLPIRFRYERNFSTNLSFYANIGMTVSFHLQSMHQGRGEFDYSGFYPRYQQTLQDIPQYGFNSDVQETGNFQTSLSDLSRNDLNVSGAASLGFNYESKSGLVIYLGATGFKNILESTRQKSSNYISEEYEDYNGLLPVINSINFGGYGLELGIRKKFRSRNGIVKMTSK